MITQKRFFFLIFITLSFLCIVWGCAKSPPPADPIAIAKAEIIKQMEYERNTKLEAIKEDLKEAFLLGTIIYVSIGLAGPAVAEGARKIVTQRFHLSPKAQIKLAASLYLAVMSSFFIFSILNKDLRTVIWPVILLLAATAYPFFIHVIPSIKTEEKMRRKAAVAQIKAFLMLILIFYIILKTLSPEGFGSIQMR